MPTTTKPKKNKLPKKPRIQTVGEPPPDLRNTTLPSGILAHDPDAMPPRRPAAQAIVRTPARVPLAKCVRHPENRHPLQEAVEELAESIRANGVLEPPLVRAIAGGNYQIVSGETRILAMRAAKYSGEIDVYLVQCDDAQALELLALCNAHRRDLNPIEKARMLQRLCQPAEEGGGGLSRAAAAKIYGFENHSAASNLLGLLELPQAWQDLVASGEVPVTFARCLLPFKHTPGLLHIAANKRAEDFESEYEWERSRWQSRDEFESAIETAIRSFVRECDGTGHFTQAELKEVGGDWNTKPAKLDPEKYLGELGIVELKLEGDEAPIPYATNLKAWLKVQKELLAKKGAKAKAKAERDEPAASKKELSPAEKKEQRKVQDGQLARRIEHWRSSWCRRLIADHVRSKQDVVIAWQLVLWLSTQPYLAHGVRGRIADLLEVATSAKSKQSAIMKLPTNISALGLTAVSYAAEYLTLDAACESGFATDEDLIEYFLAYAMIDLADAWGLLWGSTPERAEQLRSFFALHLTDQLRDLGKELGRTIPEGSTKKGAIDLLMQKPTSCPKSLAKAAKKGGRS